jgi:hypothetical protein
MTTAAFVVGYLCGLVIVCMFVWIGTALHMAYTQMDLLLGLLKNCSVVMARAPLRVRVLGQAAVGWGICGIVTFPGVYL